MLRFCSRHSADSSTPCGLTAAAAAVEVLAGTFTPAAAAAASVEVAVGAPGVALLASAAAAAGVAAGDCRGNRKAAGVEAGVTAAAAAVVLLLLLLPAAWLPTWLVKLTQQACKTSDMLLCLAS
jgi:hypothetical protein